MIQDHVRDFEDMPGAIYSVKTFDGTDVYVQARLASTIQFTDGTRS
jgi:hypothetical protein